jgi:hypothetical protein
MVKGLKYQYKQFKLNQLKHPTLRTTQYTCKKLLFMVNKLSAFAQISGLLATCLSPQYKAHLPVT